MTEQNDGERPVKQTLRDQVQPTPTKATRHQSVRTDDHSPSALRHNYHPAPNSATRGTKFISKFSHCFKPLYFTQTTIDSVFSLRFLLVLTNHTV